MHGHTFSCSESLFRMMPEVLLSPCGLILTASIRLHLRLTPISGGHLQPASLFVGSKSSDFFQFAKIRWQLTAMLNRLHAKVVQWFLMNHIPWGYTIPLEYYEQATLQQAIDPGSNGSRNGHTIVCSYNYHSSLNHIGIFCTCITHTTKQRFEWFLEPYPLGSTVYDSIGAYILCTCTMHTSKQWF